MRLRAMFEHPSRCLFNIVAVFLPLKIVMTMEGHQVDDEVPKDLWNHLAPHFVHVSHDRPTYNEVMSVELTATAQRMLGNDLSVFTTCKFNRLQLVSELSGFLRRSPYFPMHESTYRTVAGPKYGVAESRSKQ